MRLPEGGVKLGESCQEKHNYQEAVKYYKEAAAASDAVGQYYMGVMYKNGWGIEQNVSKP